MKVTRLLYNYIRMKQEAANIVLTPQENLLFSTLKQYKHELGLTTVMRVAGGWVRDKIMGKESHDIDITLDNMKGEEFVMKLKQYALTKNEKVSSFGVTKFNPELSKHLETATAKIHGQNIDFVNLRSESYNNQSRIPQIVQFGLSKEMGTPLTDALRRDFTINSLFFNIDTGEVEDYTEKGIKDIHEKRIRTPLPPLVTFKDDPLRVLRCFRFKARFDFSVDEQIYASLTNQEVHEALRTKVSKQRIGIQLAGLLKAQHPWRGMQDIFKYKFWNIIFQVPSQSDLKDQEYINSIPELGFSLLSIGMNYLGEFQLKTQKELLMNEEIKDKRIRYSKDELKLLILISLMSLPYQGYKVAVGKKWMPLPEHICLNELKYSAKVAKFVQKTGELTYQLQNVLKVGQQSALKLRVVKWLKQAEQKWQIATHCLNTIRATRNEIKLEIQPIQLRQWIFQNKLQDSYLVHAFIDGNFLTKRGKKGLIIRVILENAVIWRILNPEATYQQFLQTFQKESQFFQNEKSYFT